MSRPLSPLKTRLLHFALAVSSTCLMVAVCEVFLRAVRPSRFGVYELPAVYQPDSELGYRYAAGSSGRKRVNVEVDQQVSINSNGFYGEVYPIERRAGRPRIAMLGDSFVVGFEVPYEKTYPSELQRLIQQQPHYDGCEVVNFGLDGTGTEQHRIILERFALAYRPDLVLLTYFANDVADVAYGIPRREIYRDQVLLFRDEDPQLLKDRVDRYLDSPSLFELACRYTYLARQFKRSVTRDAPMSNMVKSREVPLRTIEQARELVVSEIADIKRQCDQAGCRFVVAMMPSQQIIETLEPSDEHESFEFVSAGIVNSQIELVNLLELFRSKADGGPYFWQNDGHCNAQGYALMAQGVAAYLAEE